MADPSGLAKTAFYNNLLLVKALILIKPPEERRRAKHWAEVLGVESATGEELATKNEYLWYLLLNLQYGDMRAPPFDKHPPPGRLRPLSTVIDAETYQKVVNGIKNEIFFRDTFEQISGDKMKRANTTRFDDSNSYAHGIPWTTVKSAERTMKSNKSQSQRTAWSDQIAGEEDVKMSHRPQGDYVPSEFITNQPRPNLGAFCYGAVFSDYGKTEAEEKLRRD